VRSSHYQHSRLVAISVPQQHSMGRKIKREKAANYVQVFNVPVNNSTPFLSLPPLFFHLSYQWTFLCCSQCHDVVDAVTPGHSVVLPSHMLEITVLWRHLMRDVSALQGRTGARTLAKGRASYEKVSTPLFVSLSFLPILSLSPSFFHFTSFLKSFLSTYHNQS